MYVLIVDDEAGIRHAVTRVLVNAGHRCCTAETGDGALTQMRLERPDLVLLDMMLGYAMTGWEVCDAKKRDPTIASIPTIILSGLHPEAVRLRGVTQVSVLSEVNLIMGKEDIFLRPGGTAKLLRAMEHIAALKELASA